MHKMWLQTLTKKLSCIRTNMQSLSQEESLCEKMRHTQTEKQRRIHRVECDDEMFLGMIEMKETEWFQIEGNDVETKEVQTGVEKWTETLKVNKNNLIVKLDTGADCNFISVRELEMLKIDRKEMKNSRCKLVTYSGHNMSPLGQQRIKSTV